MDKRRAKQKAHSYAWRVMQCALNDDILGSSLDNFSRADKLRIEHAYEDLLHDHIEKSGDATRQDSNG